MSELRILNSCELHWGLDFSPRNPRLVQGPVLAARNLNQLWALNQFQKKNQEELEVLVLQGGLEDVVEDIYPSNALAPLERLRLNLACGIKSDDDFLSSLALDFQNFLDDRHVPLKSLKPLKHLQNWVTQIEQIFRGLKPTHSQIREILDDLCDLKDLGSPLPIPKLEQGCSQWIVDLKGLRYPRASQKDREAQNRVSSIPWPKGLDARWLRRGDSAGVALSTCIRSPQEWENLKKKLSEMTIPDDLWKN